MSSIIILLLIIDSIIIVPLVSITIHRGYLNHKYEASKIKASLLGFLISINGAIRTGKTSFQSGLSHIYQIEIEEKLKLLLSEIMIIYNKLDFSIINKLLDEYFKKNETIEFQYIYEKTLKEIKNQKINQSLILNFITSKKSKEQFQDYIFAYWVLNFRKNYVHSKTNFYSHVTFSFNFNYKIEQQKIHDAYALKDYSIYDYMIELIDEASDEIGANKRYEDVKEEAGDKDYRRKFGQIHQERNRMITTKQDVRDEIKKFRSLTQSNLWLPKPIKVVGNYNFTFELINLFIAFSFSVYKLFRLFIPYLLKKILNTISKETTYEDYTKHYFETVNVERKILNKLLHIKWFLISIGFNKYEIWNYASEEDVKKRDSIYYDKLIFHIPTMYCFGTYDTHFYRIIQNELLAATQTKSSEINWYFNPGYFKDEDMMGGGVDDINF